MSGGNCDTCGGVLFFDSAPGAMLDGYCRKCDPKDVKLVSSDSDNIEIQGSPGGSLGTVSAIKLPPGGSVTLQPQPQVLTTNTTNAVPPLISINDPGDVEKIVGIEVNTDDVTKVVVFQVNDIPLFKIHKDLPENEAVGALAYIEGESTAYVFDGLDWVNLGELARLMRVAGNKRREAIAATKAKHKREEEAEDV